MAENNLQTFDVDALVLIPKGGATLQQCMLEALRISLTEIQPIRFTLNEVTYELRPDEIVRLIELRCRNA